MREFLKMGVQTQNVSYTSVLLCLKFVKSYGAKAVLHVLSAIESKPL